jgi:hypothetical protein
MPSSRAGPARGGAQPSSEADLVRGGGAEPSSEADPARGGAQPSSEADLVRGGGAEPSSEADPARGGAPPSSEADLVRGAGLRPRARRTSPERASIPRARRISLEGHLRCCPGGPRGPPRSCLCCVSVSGVQVELRLRFLQVLSGFPLDYLGDP